MAALQLQAGDDSEQVGVAAPLAVAVGRALHVQRAARHGDQRVGNGAGRVVVEVHAEPRPGGGGDLSEHAGGLVGQRPAVGVAERERVGTCLGGGRQDVQGVAAVGAVAVEEVLGVEDPPPALGGHEAHRVGHHRQVLLAGGTQRLVHVQGPGLADQRDDRRPGREENLAMVADSVRFMAAEGRRVVFDAEHFFDGYRADRGYALDVLAAAAEAGADTLALCDTNGGTLPDEAARMLAEVAAATGARLGVHFHDDSACAVANSLVAVAGGALHVQGAANGYGERCGNADLFAVIAGLELKRGHELLPPGRLGALATTARTIAELANLPLASKQPYVGSSAFATKAGLHASAIARRPDAYSHVDPGSVGNQARVLV